MIHEFLDPRELRSRYCAGLCGGQSAGCSLTLWEFFGLLVWEMMENVLS